jgi:hypothetical protein
MLTSHQPQILHNPLLSTEASQSFSQSQHLPISIDTIKQLISSSPPTIETSETNRILPSQTTEPIQPSVLSDTSSTTPPPVKNIKFSFANFIFFFLLDNG